MNRSESKFRHTADRMDSALISLLETKEFTEISIMDICKKAGVNRSTFYAHYDNAYELLQETYDGLIKNFLTECKFEAPDSVADLQDLSKDELNFITPKYLLPYLQYVKKHKRFFKIYADNPRVFQSDKMDNYIVERIFAPIYEKHGVTDKKLIRYMQKYFLKGIDAIIKEWVQNGCEDDMFFVCEIITFCVRPTTYK